jgi:hypothetical protein
MSGFTSRLTPTCAPSGFNAGKLCNYTASRTPALFIRIVLGH